MPQRRRKTCHRFPTQPGQILPSLRFCPRQIVPFHGPPLRTQHWQQVFKCVAKAFRVGAGEFADDPKKGGQSFEGHGRAEAFFKMSRNWGEMPGSPATLRTLQGAAVGIQEGLPQPAGGRWRSNGGHSPSVYP